MVLFLFFLMIFLNKDYLNLLIIGIHIKLHKPSNNKGGSISTITIIKAAIKQPLDFLVFLNLGGFSVGVSVSGCCGSECMCNTSK